MGSIRELIGDLVGASLVLVRHGVADAFGRVSVRHPLRPTHFLLSRNIAPGLVTAADPVEFGSWRSGCTRDGA